MAYTASEGGEEVNPHLEVQRLRGGSP
jgi:hypothetical protein